MKTVKESAENVYNFCRFHYRWKGILRTIIKITELELVRIELHNISLYFLHDFVDYYTANDI